MRRAHHDLDLRPDRYTHYYESEFRERFHPLMDTRRWGLGERLVFETYAREAHDETSTGSPATASSTKAARTQPLRRFGDFVASGVGRHWRIL